MKEHEVPTHVQAEDRVLLWFTFPQIAAMMASCGLAYGVWRYAPVGPSEVRIGLAVAVGLVGIVGAVGKIGGRRLPLAAADLLKFRLMPRLYEGPAGELSRSEPPPSEEKAPNPLSLFAGRLRRRAAVLRRARRRSKHRGRGKETTRKKRKKTRGERRPFRPHAWFGKRRRRAAVRFRAAVRRRRAAMVVAALGVLALTAANLGTAEADEPPPGYEWDWVHEVEFRPLDPVRGRRVFVEDLAVYDDRAEVVLRAATAVDLRVRAYGGRSGLRPLFFGTARLARGERVDYTLPLSGERPSLEFSWVDSLGQAGTVTLRDGQLPRPLPPAENRLCSVRLEHVRATPHGLDGALSSTCTTTVRETFDLQTLGGHREETHAVVMEATVASISGTVTVAVSNGAGSGSSVADVAFVPGGETHFSVPVPSARAVRSVTVAVDLSASLEVALPPLTLLTHRQRRHDSYYETAWFTCPGRSETVERTVEIEHPDGKVTRHVVKVDVTVPSQSVSQSVAFHVFREEHVRAAAVERDPILLPAAESFEIGLTVGTDDPYEALVLPTQSEPPRAVHVPLTPGEIDVLFGMEFTLW